MRSICDTLSESAFSSWDTLFFNSVDSLVDSCLVPMNLNARVVSDSVTRLEWTGNDSSFYRVELQGTDTSFLIIDTMVLDTMLEAYGLIMNQRYQFRVQSICDSLQTSEFSEWYMFDLMIDTMPEDSCSIPLHPVAEVFADSSALLSWSGNTGVYEIMVDHDLDSIFGPVDSIIMDTMYALVNLMPNVNYRFQVRSICDSTDTSNFTDWVSFSLNDLVDTTNVDSCRAPDTLFIDSKLTTAEVAWNLMSASVVYEIEVEQLGLAPGYHFITETLDSSVSLMGLTAGKGYQIRITQYCSDTTASIGNWITFETLADSIMLDCPVPDDLLLTGVSEQSAILSWNGNERVFDYEIEIQSLDTTSFLEFKAYTRDTFYLLQGLTYPGLYQVKATSYCKDGSISEDSDWIEFSSMSSDSMSGISRQINVFPNPVKHQFQIKVPDTGFGPITYFQLSDLQGRVVMSEKRDGLIANELLAFPVSGLREGVYQLLVRTIEGAYSQSIYIAK